MSKKRLTAFSDGVIAIIITITVLELRAPHGDDWTELSKLWPIFLSYVLGFLYMAIYWKNHHLQHAFKHVPGFCPAVDLLRNLHIRAHVAGAGLDLAADPEFAPHVIEPLKLQGVQKFGDYGAKQPDAPS